MGSVEEGEREGVVEKKAREVLEAASGVVAAKLGRLLQNQVTFRVCVIDQSHFIRC